MAQNYSGDFNLLDLRSFHYWNDLIATIASLTSNLVLLYFIFFKTTVELKPYSRILLQTCVLDIFFATCTFLVKLQIEFKDGIFLLMVSGFLGKTLHPTNFLLNCLFVFAMYFNIAALPIQFYYRYLIICKEQTLRLLKFFGCFLVAGVFSTGFIIVYGICTFPTLEKINRFKYVVDTPSWWDEENKPPNFIGSDLTDKWLIIMLLYAGSIVSIAYVLILWFSWRIWHSLKLLKATMSEHEQEMQRQFTMALAAQAICPLFTAFLPVLTAIICIFTKIHIPGLGLVIMAAIAWITFINPTCVLLAVSPYRTALFYWMSCISSTPTRRIHTHDVQRRGFNAPDGLLPPLRGRLPRPVTAPTGSQEFSMATNIFMMHA